MDKARLILALLIIILGIIGLVLPIIPGIALIVSGVCLVNPEWAKSVLRKCGIKIKDKN